MRTSIIALAIAATALGGCTFKSTRIEPAQTPAHAIVEPAPAPVIIYQTPPPVVYQAPARTVVYQAQAPAVPVTPPVGSVNVNYTGPNGYQLAWQKADSYCVAHYGNSRVELMSNDEAAGRAMFGCYRI